MIHIGYYNTSYRLFIDRRDSIMSILLKTPHEIAQLIAKQAQAKRLALNLSQNTLAERSGVSYGVLKKFERTGKISLESLLKLALVLNDLSAFQNLFSYHPPKNTMSLDDLIKDKPRQRGRQ